MLVRLEITMRSELYTALLTVISSRLGTWVWAVPCFSGSLFVVLLLMSASERCVEAGGKKYGSTPTNSHAVYVSHLPHAPKGA